MNKGLTSTLGVPLCISDVKAVLVNVLYKPTVNYLANTLANIISKVFSPVVFTCVPMATVCNLTTNFLDGGGVVADVPGLVADKVVVTLLNMMLSSPVATLIFNKVARAKRNMVVAFLHTAKLKILPTALVSSFYARFLSGLLSYIIYCVVMGKVSGECLDGFGLNRVCLGRGGRGGSLFSSSSVTSRGASGGASDGRPRWRGCVSQNKSL